MSVVSCQLSVVDVVFGRRGNQTANRLEVAVQLGAKFIKKWLELRNGFLREESSAIAPAQPMLGFVQRSARVSHEPTVVSIRATPYSLSNIGSDAIRGSDDLRANSAFREVLPAKGCIPNRVCDFLRQFVNAKVLKVCSHRLMAVLLAKRCLICQQLTTDN